MKKKKVNYPEKFKVQAVALASQIGAAKAARQLGVSGGSIATWKKSQLKNSDSSIKPVKSNPH